MMEHESKKNRIRINLLLTFGAVLFAAAAFVLWLFLHPRPGAGGSFVIRYGGETLTVPADETRTIVIRDGKLVDEATGEGDENVIRIENGSAWMERANCPHEECVKQGVLNAENAGTRPLGAWIICAPHRVYIEYAGGDA
ncbi:MAG: NusG domain II-containing protein [Clostridia bacterium]|nr:NusG domain II-containing protein [Clostridia bacterium]